VAEWNSVDSEIEVVRFGITFKMLIVGGQIDNCRKSPTMSHALDIYVLVWDPVQVRDFIWVCGMEICQP
jgi:hypothetical protein